MSTYEFHISQCKEVYREIALEIDHRNSKNIENLAKLIKYKNRKGYVSRSKFLILGPNSEEKNTFLQKLRICIGAKVINPINVLQ